MPVRDTSAISHDSNEVSFNKTKKHQLRQWVRQYGPATRKQIAVGMGLETATVSGLVTPLVRDGFLEEVGKVQCPITGNTAIQVASPVIQIGLFDRKAA